MGNNVSFKKEFGLIVVGAIVFTASFMWKDMLSDIRELYFPKEYGIAGRLLFTIVITMLLILLAVELKHMWKLNGTPPEQPIIFDDNPIDKSEE